MAVSEALAEGGLVEGGVLVLVERGLPAQLLADRSPRLLGRAEQQSVAIAKGDSPLELGDGHVGEIEHLPDLLDPPDLLLAVPVLAALLGGSLLASLVARARVLLLSGDRRRLVGGQRGADGALIEA